MKCNALVLKEGLLTVLPMKLENTTVVTHKMLELDASYSIAIIIKYSET